jgi:hypothetical protein
MDLLGVEQCTYHSFKPYNAFQLLVLSECEKLSLEQISALVAFYSIKKLVGSGTEELKGEIRVPMDLVEEVFFAYRAGDQVKLKLLLGKVFTRDGTNFSEVTYDFARNEAPIVYESALAKVKDGRVQMEPCELTLLPIKHCRWCGLVRHEVLRLCQECEGDLTFPDRTWFCGDECERQAMDKLHREEHVRHLLLAIGIEDGKARVVRPELQTEAPKSSVEKKKKKKSGRAKK